MSTLGSYPRKEFNESLELYSYSPSTQQAALVPGSSIVQYLALDGAVVLAISTTDVAVTEDLRQGASVRTAGESAIGDGGGGDYVVVPAGEGDIAMLNGMELKLLPAGSLAGSDVTDSLVTHDGFTETVGAAVTGKVAYIGCIAENIAGRAIIDGGQVSATGWHAGSEMGGGIFVGNASVAKSQHNGITVVSPTVPAVSAQAGATFAERRDNFLAGAGETDPAGLGVFVRVGPVTAPEQAGAAGDDATDDAGAFNALAAIAEVAALRCDKAYFLSQDVIFNRSVALLGSGSIRMVGARLRIEGSLTELGSVSTTAANEGDRSLTVASLSGLSAGDLIVIHNQTSSSFAPHRANYQDGEFAEVLSVSGDIITLTAPLESTYAVATTNKVFKVNSVTPSLGRLSITGDTGYAVEVKHARGGSVDARRIAGGTFGALALNKSFGLTLKGGEYHNAAADTGLQYGIAVLNCQDINGHGVSAHGTRHGITTGGDIQDGAVPNRRVKFHDCIISNDQPAIHCTDFHGNTKDSGFYNCDSLGDVSLGGVNVEYVGGSVRSAGGSAPFQGGEVNGGYIRFKGINLKFDSSSSSGSTLYRFRDSAESAQTENDVTIEIENIEVGANTLLTSLLNLFVNFPASTKSNWSLKNIRLKSPLTGIQRVVIATLSGTGTRPESIVVEDIDTPRSSVQQWMSTSGSFAGTRVTLPASHFKGAFTIAAGSGASPSQGFTYPLYPSLPALTLVTTGAAGDSTGGYVEAVQGAAQATTSATIRAVTSTGNTANAAMSTNIIGTAAMQDYVL